MNPKGGCIQEFHYNCDPSLIREQERLSISFPVPCDLECVKKQESVVFMQLLKVQILQSHCKEFMRYCSFQPFLIPQAVWSNMLATNHSGYLDLNLISIKQKIPLPSHTSHK